MSAPSVSSIADNPKVLEAEASGRSTPLEKCHESTKKPSKDFGIFPVPSHLQYDPLQPSEFGLALNFGFAFASTFSEYSNTSTFLFLTQLPQSCSKFVLLSTTSQ